jgi:pyruvate,water dikinase
LEAYVVQLQSVGMNDVDRVGGKNASLGEMISNLGQLGIQVPDGFATTAQAYRDFLEQNDLGNRISSVLAALDVDNLDELAKTGHQIRTWIAEEPLPRQLHTDIELAWKEMVTDRGDEMSVAVRSSATAEDLPEASFAGQQETFLNISGLPQLLSSVKEVYASLYNDRAIAYRVHQGFSHEQVALSVGVQHMVRSDLASSGVMFTLDTESGFREMVLITAAYGLGETIVQGAVNPDEFYVYKPALRSGRRSILRKNIGSKEIKMVYGDAQDSSNTVSTVDVDLADSMRFSLEDHEVETLARYALIIEDHYGCPMDIEWGKDGRDGQLYLLQARPETVQSRPGNTIQRYTLKKRSKLLTQGRSIGHRIGSGSAKIIRTAAEMNRIQSGDVLVADMTDPDWEPVMKRASAIVTNRGGRTCHAAIIARELGVPAVVGCGDATDRIGDNSVVTVSCAEGDEGFIYEGCLDYEQQLIEIDNLPKAPVNIMMNIGNPDRAFDFANIPLCV